MQLHLDKKHRILCNIPSIMPVRYNVLIPMHCERLASRNSQKMRMDFVQIYDERFTHYCISYYMYQFRSNTGHQVFNFIETRISHTNF